MLIRFWGVRGSLPTPLSSQQIQSKIMAAIQRITPDDIVNENARAKFISSLPSWIFGTAGGNTPCVQVQVDDTELIFDAGTGIRVLGKSQFLPKDNHYKVYLFLIPLIILKHRLMFIHQMKMQKNICKIK